jgi:hypothetical protein
MAKKDVNSPATTSEAYDIMSPQWAKIDTLLAGTDAMREAATLYLPQHTEESNEAYDERRRCTTLLNMLQFTLDTWVSKPFNKPIEVKEDVPEQIKPLLEDIDLQGNHLDVFARNWFRDGLAKGLSHVLVEFPRVKPREDGQPRTLADDRNEKLRPYLVHIAPENLIFAYSEVVEGQELLLHVRIRETVTKMDKFGEVKTERIRVIEPNKVFIYEFLKQKNKKAAWVEVEKYDYEFPVIPLVTFYADRQGFMLAKPPMSDLADLNIRHWQSTSDQIAVLTVARFPMLACSGAIDDKKLRVGPNAWLNTPETAGKFYYVEHTGAAIEAGRKDLLDLEETMAQYGATFLRRRPGGASATARALDEAECTSPLMDMAVRFRDALEQAMRYMAMWMKLDDGGSYAITTDFGLSDSAGAVLTALQSARATGDISRKRYVGELKRLGVLSDDFEFTVSEQERTDEGPPISATPQKSAPVVANSK